MPSGRAAPDGGLAVSPADDRRINRARGAMKSEWVDRDAEAMVADGAQSGIGRDLALRVYTTRLLGRDPKLVLHGGGNTSLKTRMRDVFGEEVDVLRVKATGADMATLGPAGLPAVRLFPMRKLREFDAIGDEELVGIERANLIDPAAPNPSVEMMLHAFLPHKFVDHTHATAVLSLIDQPDGEKKCAEVFRERLAFVPYLMPGFGLAKKSIEVFESVKPSDGLILSKHGIVTFGDSAREAYERMIEMVSLAEDFIALNRKAVSAAAPTPRNLPALADVTPIVRGACSEEDDRAEGAWRRLVLDFRATDAVLTFVNGNDVTRVSQAGVVTPDHTIRTKNWPLVLPHPEVGKLDDFKRTAHDAASAFAGRYREYFERHNKRVGGIKHELDPLPRVVLVPGLGLFGLGRTKRDAVIAADIAEAWVEGVSDAEAIGRFEVHLRSRHVRLRVLAARTSQTRHAQESCRSRDRSPPSPVPPARSAPPPRRHSRQRAPRSRCSTSICPLRERSPAPSARRRLRSNAT